MRRACEHGGNRERLVTADLQVERVADAVVLNSARRKSLVLDREKGAATGERESGCSPGRPAGRRTAIHTLSGRNDHIGVPLVGPLNQALKRVRRQVVVGPEEEHEAAGRVVEPDVARVAAGPPEFAWWTTLKTSGCAAAYSSSSSPPPSVDPSSMATTSNRSVPKVWPTRESRQGRR